MAKINFKELELEININEFTKVDFRKELGNFLFHQANTLQIDLLARKIFTSEEAVEIDAEEYKTIIDAFKRQKLNISYMQAIEKAFNGKEK